MSEAAAAQTIETLGFVRTMRARGELELAAQVLDAALREPTVAEAPTVELASQSGWLQLERADMFADAGQLPLADGRALLALQAFENAVDLAGSAAACLLLGDVTWQAGDARGAASWWARARSLADSAGATPLAARALMALALREFGAGEPAVGEALLDAAQDRAEHGLDLALAASDEQTLETARELADGVRAGLALLRARRALVSRHWAEARLLLSGAVEAARRLQRPELYIDALRLDAALARRLGDPRSAVDALKLALQAANRLQAWRLAWLVQAELVLALADNEAWEEAFALQDIEPPEEIANQPAVLAARLESFAVLALRAGRLPAAEEALVQAEKLRFALDDRAATARTLALRAENSLLLGQLDDANAFAEQLLALATPLERRDLALDAALIQLRVKLLQQDPSAAQFAETVSLTAVHSGGVAHQLAALDGQAAALLQVGDGPNAQIAADRALTLARAQPLLRLRARANARVAQTLMYNGDLQKAARTAAESAAIAENASDHAAHVRALLVAAQVLRATARHDESLLALQHAQKAGRLSQRADVQTEVAFELANTLAALHQWPQALQIFGDAAVLARSAGMVAVAVRALRGVATARRMLGNGGGALEALAEAQNLANSAQLLGETAACAVDAAQMAIDRGDAQAARDLMQLWLPQMVSLPLAVQGDALILLGRAQVTLGEIEEAGQSLDLAVKTLRRAAQPRSLGAALLLAGQVHGMLGHGQICGELLSEALVITAQHGLPEQQIVRQVIERLQGQNAAVEQS